MREGAGTVTGSRHFACGRSRGSRVGGKERQQLCPSRATAPLSRTPARLSRAAARDGPDSSGWTEGSAIVGYWSKQRERKTDSFGRLLYDEDNVAEPHAFQPRSAKLRLAAQVVARDEGVPEEELMARIGELDVLVPGLASAEGGLKPADVARLALDLDGVASRVLALKRLFPSADVSAAVTAWPAVLLMEAGAVEAAAAEDGWRGVPGHAGFQ